MAFIGMRLPSIAATTLWEIPVPGRATPLREMNVQLAFLGNQVPMEQIFRSLECCYTVAQEYAPFELTAALLTSFPKDSEGMVAVVARIVTPLIFDIRTRLVQLLEMNKVQYSKSQSQYKPHVTLSYAKHPVAPQRIKPVRWPAQWITMWGGDKADQLFSAEIELRGQKR